ncbi:DUF4245 domain-containing protein [Nesterenkonia sp.]|uniref:DUF4245 domain-containing protein n=1 Tax=Nesterenkonia sp. TaxID=704201 RepID=UPI0026250EEC|nr:DUF4245 domain-containing protein [Nesterenkonia sp.]
MTDPNAETHPPDRPASAAAGDSASSEEQPIPQLTEAQAKRLATPMMGMVITMGALVLVLGALWFINPEPDVTYTRDEDVPAAAAWTDEVTEYSPLAPQVPPDWSANYARWESLPEHDLEVWEVGYTTSESSFVGFAQTDEATESWINAETDQAETTGTVSLGGFDFETRQKDERRYYVLRAEDNTVDGTTVVIGGDASDQEFSRAVEAIAESIGREVPAADPETDQEQTP